MIRSALTLCTTSALASSAMALPIAIGTNTGGSGNSEGIYMTDFDIKEGTFDEVVLAAKYDSPGFLALHPTKPVVYSVGRSEISRKGTIAAFQIGGTTQITSGGVPVHSDKPLQLIGDAPSGGVNPCHLAVSPDGKSIAVANYGDGSTTLLPITSLGVPQGPMLPIMKGEGTGPRTDRQEGPHAHGVYFANRYLFVPDLGLDKVLTYYHAELTPDQSKLLPNQPAFWASAPGAGPRHMAFTSDFGHAYIVNELDNTITACASDAINGKLETLHSVSTLPDGWKGNSTTAEIQIHPRGEFVYASNRGHDSIAVYARDTSSGRLTRIQIAPCGGKTPRHFTISPDGNWLLCAHQDSNTISALPLDPETGKLGEPSGSVSAPNPICLLFLPTEF